MSFMNFDHVELFAVFILNFVTANSATVLLTLASVSVDSSSYLFPGLTDLFGGGFLVSVFLSLYLLFGTSFCFNSLHLFSLVSFLLEFFHSIPLYLMWGYWFPLRFYWLELRDQDFHFCIFRDYLFQCCPPPSLLKNIKYYFRVALCLLEHYFP